MKTLNIELKNCYGIKSLKQTFDFSQCPTYAIYAPNGAMKTSLARTFMDVAEGVESSDRIFTKRKTTRKIIDETGKELPSDDVLVIEPYDESLGLTEKTSTLLVDSKLRKEYEALYADIEKAKSTFLKAMKVQSGSRSDLEQEISSTFTTSDNEFYRALIRIRDELQSQKESPFANVVYDVIFDDKVIDLLGTKDFKTAINDYIRKYNELLDASTYFKKGIFNYYNAAMIAKSLADNGFFDAKHTVNLNAGKTLEIANEKQLEELISKEKEAISTDKELRKKFAELEKLITKNLTVRAFQDYVTEHEELLPELANVASFKEKVWKSYIKTHMDLYEDLIDKYQSAEKRKKEIETEAARQRTQWESVIEIFNSRFFVPFKLTAKNRIEVMLGQEDLLTLGFIFEDGGEKASVDREELMQVLSTGEKKALYILNIIFEIEVRKKAKQQTTFVVDDVADSFDYKNKYAIIQYLQDIADEPYFKQIILTHNFDFFRTVQSRFVAYTNCLMVAKSSNSLTMLPATGIKNIFVHDWKQHFFEDQKKKIASIPFMRNIIEYTRGEQDNDFIRLTSLLHWKSDSAALTVGDLDNVFNSLFNSKGASPNAKKLMVDVLREEATACVGAKQGLNFENKIVLAIATRIAAEKYMVEKINDAKSLASIKANQTPALLGKFKEKCPKESSAIDVLQRVILMTPENIHLNSFMYEPILDMSDDHLRKLYTDTTALK